MYLSVIIPAYNEEINLRRGVLNSVSGYLKTKKFEWEVLIINDGSKDSTSKIVGQFIKENPGFCLFNEEHSGKGGSIIKGFEKSKGDVVLFTDMDQSTPIDQFDKFINKFDKGFDVVIGSRNGRPGQSPIRKFMAYGFVFLRTLVLRLPYKDTQCGFKAFKASKAREIFKRLRVFNSSSGFEGGSVTAGFDLEVLYIARKLTMRVAEVPVEWYEYGERKEVNPIKDSWEGFRDLMKVRLNALMGKYRE